MLGFVLKTFRNKFILRSKFKALMAFDKSVIKYYYMNTIYVFSAFNINCGKVAYK